MELLSLNLPNPPEFAGFKNSATSTLAAPSADLVQALLGFPAAAGKPVTRQTAIRVASVLSSVKMMANDIAKMPLITRQTQVLDGRQRTLPALKNPLYPLLKYSPNSYQTSFEFRFHQATQLIMNGNCFAQKITNQAGDILELIPLDAWLMEHKWDYTGGPAVTDSGNERKIVKDRSGKPIPVLVWHYPDGQQRIRKFYQEDLLRVAAHNLDSIGLIGSSMIALAKEAISVLIAAEEFAGRNFANGLGMAGFLSFPPDVEITEKQAQGVVDDLKKNFSGSQNAGKFSILPYGGKYEKVVTTPAEAQLLESRQWNEQEIARMFGGAPLIVKLGLSKENATYASSSAFLDEYFNTTLLPYTTAIEQSITRDLIDKADRGTIFVKHQPDVILRGGPAERAKEYKDRIISGQMTLNESRILEDKDTIEGADVLSLPANSCIFDINKQEWFIPAQMAATPGEGEAPNSEDEQEPDAQGGDESDNDQPTKPAKKPVKKAESTVIVNKLNRLIAVANSLAERVMRKEAKGGIDAKFVAEVMNISKEKAEAYIAGRDKLNEQEARAALVALAQGD